jgi:hypothetical protein
VSYVPQMALLTGIVSMRTVVNCFLAHEIASRRYMFYWWLGGISIIESVFLYGIMGVSFFTPWLPTVWIKWVEALNPARLEFMLGVMFICSLAWMIFMAIHLLVERKNRYSAGLAD